MFDFHRRHHRRASRRQPGPRRHRRASASPTRSSRRDAAGRGGSASSDRWSAAVTIARASSIARAADPRATFARVVDRRRRTARIDQVVVTWFAAPHSYTGEDVVEISGHGSPLLLRRIVELAIARGARLAEPGEFTLRAYLNGRIDLAQAEAVADLVDAVTPLQARAAMDQLEGTLTDAIARDRRGAVRSVGAPRGVARLSRRRISLRHARRRRRRAARSRATRSTRSPATAGPAASSARAGLVVIAGPPERRQVEPVQRARRRRARDCHRHSRHDARRADRARGHRRACR